MSELESAFSSGKYETLI